MRGRAGGDRRVTLQPRCAFVKKMAKASSLRSPKTCFSTPSTREKGGTGLKSSTCSLVKKETLARNVCYQQTTRMKRFVTDINRVCSPHGPLDRAALPRRLAVLACTVLACTVLGCTRVLTFMFSCTIVYTYLLTTLYFRATRPT